MSSQPSMLSAQSLRHLVSCYFYYEHAESYWLNSSNSEKKSLLRYLVLIKEYKYMLTESFNKFLGRHSSWGWLSADA
jgi:hypothetical protein